MNVKSLVEREATKFTVQSVTGIRRCMLIERSDDFRYKGQKRLFLVTEGINLMVRQVCFLGLVGGEGGGGGASTCVCCACVHVHMGACAYMYSHVHILNMG